MIDGNIIPGGHRVQLDQTARFLRELGVEVEVSFEEEMPIEEFDLVHSFGLPPQCLRRCRQARVPVVISPIYWARSYITGQDQAFAGRAEAARNWINRVRQGLSLARSSLRNRSSEACQVRNARLDYLIVTYEMADLLLPNSQMEADAITADLKVTTPCHVVPNSADIEQFSLPQTPTSRDYVLCAGRLEPHKNQLGLVRAWSAEMPPLKIVGKAHPHHDSYYQKCIKEAAAKNIEILPGMPHDELPTLYQNARVHVLPTWFETTGLVSLEAALCGCNIVTTSRGYAREYFEDLAWYCDPASPNSIRSAVKEAWKTPFKSELRQRILDNYSWQHTARASLEGYNTLFLDNPKNKREINNG